LGFVIVVAFVPLPSARPVAHRTRRSRTAPVAIPLEPFTVP